MVDTRSVMQFDINPDDQCSSRACCDHRGTQMHEPMAWKSKAWILVVFSGITLMYLLTLTGYHAEGEDALNYMIAVEHLSMAEQSHANHLLFGFVNRAHYLIWETLGYTGGSELPMQLLSLFCGILSLWFLFRIMRVMGVSLGYALGLVLLLAGTHSFWFYSVESENYVVALPGLLWIIAVLQKVRLGQAGWLDYITMGLALAWAVGMNQQLILMAPVIALFCILPVRAEDRHQEDSDQLITASGMRHRIMGLGVTAALSGFLIAFMYFFCAMYLERQYGLGNIIQWSLGHGQKGTWAPFTWMNPIKGMVGLGRAWVCANVVFVVPQVEPMVMKALPGHQLIEEKYLIRHLMGWPAWFILLSIAVVSALSVLYTLLATWQCMKLILVKKASGLSGILLVSVVILGLFAIIWYPASNEFWICCMPLIVLLIAQGVFVDHEIKSRLYKHLRTVVYVLIAMTWFVNFFGGALWWRDRHNDYWYAVNKPIIEATEPGDLVIHDGGWMNNNYLRFYLDAEIRRPSLIEDSDSLTELIEDTEGSVFISGWSLDPPRFILITGELPNRDHDFWRAYFQTVTKDRKLFAHTLKDMEGYDQRIYKLKSRRSENEAKP